MDGSGSQLISEALSAGKLANDIAANCDGSIEVSFYLLLQGFTNFLACPTPINSLSDVHTAPCQKSASSCVFSCSAMLLSTAPGVAWRSSTWSIEERMSATSPARHRSASRPQILPYRNASDAEPFPIGPATHVEDQLHGTQLPRREISPSAISYSSWTSQKTPARSYFQRSFHGSLGETILTVRTHHCPQH